MSPKGLSKKHLSKVPNLPGPLAYWDDTKIALTSLLGPATPSDSTKFYNPPWCALDPNGIGNEGFDCVSWGHLPSYLAI